MAEAENTETGETTAASGDTSASGAGETTTTTEPKFTQEDLSSTAGKARNEGRRAAAKELADKLGMSIDEAAKRLAKLAEQEEAEKTEVQRAQEAAAAAEASRQKAEADAVEAKFEQRVYRKLSAAGVGSGCEDEEADRRIAMARSILTGLGVTQESSDEEIAEKLAQAKADVPGLFTAKSETGGQAARSGVTNGRPPAGGQGTPSALDRGRERYRSTRPDSSNQNDPFTGAIRRAG
jgi:hypothetical protein